MINITCPNCGTHLATSAQSGEVRCPRCNSRFNVTAEEYWTDWEMLSEDMDADEQADK